VSAYGNIFLADALSAVGTTVSYAFNVFTAASTAAPSGNKQCTVALVAPTPGGANGPDYHLRPADTCATGAGDPANRPATDIDGDARPSPGSSAPDAGADEIS